MDDARTGNVLGALALVLGDRMAEAVTAPAGLTVNDATALSALHHILGTPPIDRIREVLGLTHSGAVRLVDRLVAAGLATRGPGSDGRTVAIALTAAGTSAARHITVARAAVLTAALAPLPDADRQSLDRVIGMVLAGLMRAPGATKWICRLCDTAACGRYEERCPLEREANRRHT